MLPPNKPEPPPKVESPKEPHVNMTSSLDMPPPKKLPSPQLSLSHSNVLDKKQEKPTRPTPKTQNPIASLISPPPRGNRSVFASVLIFL